MAAAAVCGIKRSYFPDDEIASPTISKRIRYASPIRTRTTSDTDPAIESANNKPPASGEEWVDFLVKEMMSARSVDDAKSRAGSVLGALEKSISGRACSDAATRIEQEQEVVKEKLGALERENGVLKRAVGIQHARLEEKERELEECKRVGVQWEEKVRTLELNNYGLSIHLNEALKGNSSARFNESSCVLLPLVFDY